MGPRFVQIPGLAAGLTAPREPAMPNFGGLTVSRFLRAFAEKIGLLCAGPEHPEMAAEIREALRFAAGAVEADAKREEALRRIANGDCIGGGWTDCGDVSPETGVFECRDMAKACPVCLAKWALGPQRPEGIT